MDNQHDQNFYLDNLNLDSNEIIWTHPRRSPRHIGRRAVAAPARPTIEKQPEVANTLQSSPRPIESTSQPDVVPPTPQPNIALPTPRPESLEQLGAASLAMQDEPKESTAPEAYPNQAEREPAMPEAYPNQVEKESTMPEDYSGQTERMNHNLSTDEFIPMPPTPAPSSAPIVSASTEPIMAIPHAPKLTPAEFGIAAEEKLAQDGNIVDFYNAIRGYEEGK